MYSPMPWRSGRDSIRVRLTPANANTARQDTSQPEAPEPMPQNTSDGLGRAALGRRGASSARASQAKRVALPGSSSRSSAQHDRAVAARRRAAGRSRRGCPSRVLRDLAHRVGGRGRGDHGGAGQALAPATRALAQRLRVRETIVISSSASSRPAARQKETGWTTSPISATSGASSASASSMGSTPPSSAFSIGASARSTGPRGPRARRRAASAAAPARSPARPRSAPRR